MTFPTTWPASEATARPSLAEQLPQPVERRCPSQLRVMARGYAGEPWKSRPTWEIRPPAHQSNMDSFTRRYLQPEGQAGLQVRVRTHQGTHRCSQIHTYVPMRLCIHTHTPELTAAHSYLTQIHLGSHTHTPLHVPGYTHVCTHTHALNTPAHIPEHTHTPVQAHTYTQTSAHTLLSTHT